jgi:hypothetical protein
LTSRRRSGPGPTWRAPTGRNRGSGHRAASLVAGVLPRPAERSEVTVPVTDGNAPRITLAPPLAPIKTKFLVRTKKSGDPLPNGQGRHPTRPQPRCPPRTRAGRQPLGLHRVAPPRPAASERARIRLAPVPDRRDRHPESRFAGTEGIPTAGLAGRPTPSATACHPQAWNCRKARSVRLPACALATGTGRRPASVA